MKRMKRMKRIKPVKLIKIKSQDQDLKIIKNSINKNDKY